MELAVEKEDVKEVSDGDNNQESASEDGSGSSSEPEDSSESESEEEKFGRYAERKDSLECHTPETIRQRRRKLAMSNVKAVHVGDSLHHDVHGAVNAGLDVIFVSKHGVHKKDLYTLKEGSEGGTAAGVHDLDPQDLLNGTCDLCDRLGILRPSYIVESFSM